MMAIVVDLPLQRQSRLPPVHQEGGATILFFMGVRYERETEETEEAPLDAVIAAQDIAAADVRAAI